MGDAAIRALFVAGIVLAALGFARLAPRLSARRAERAQLVLDGIDGRVLFFSDRTCRRCDTVREMLQAVGEDFVEIVYDEDPAAWERIGVGAVPLVVVRDGRGRVVDTVAGVPAATRLAGALRS